MPRHGTALGAWGGRAAIEGAHVLDAFAGTRALGLEALSRGAATAVFFEPDRAALTEFILASTRKGLRTILVVHGRGRGSPGGQPILKHATAQWLSHGTLSGYVLAFTTARPQDGGAGAMCVLLRRERRRAPFDVLHGTTKWRD